MRTPILRLIMDLRGTNQNFISLGGDLSTLPVLSQLFQLQLQPHEELVISSEDIRSMFYIIGLPMQWAKYLAFARPVPKQFNPPGVTGDCVLYSKVLPMGYINSVALAQHIHRAIVGQALRDTISSNQEVRRDREFPKAQHYYGTYLDNFDELSKRSQGLLASGHPSLVELLQQEYSTLGVPRNEKKAVKNSVFAEMQGAWIDGVQGIAYAKPDKASKYLVSLLEVIRCGRANRKQVQMLTGGLVYLFSFRRPLMSCLNSVWEFIVAFENDQVTKPLPRKVIEELVASFFLCGVSYMNFRVEIDEVVTASDASEAGGGLCQSLHLTEQGARASGALVRGEISGEEAQSGLLVISCFDGIGALRVALDSLKAPVAGYIAIETDQAASRVLESSFPTCEFISDITCITLADVIVWAGKYPNCCGVLVAGRPPSGSVSNGQPQVFRDLCQMVQWAREVFCLVPCLYTNGIGFQHGLEG